VQVILEPDESWSLMTVIASYAIDNAGLSQDGKQRVRRWRTDRAQGTTPMEELSVAVNEALGGYLDTSTNRVLRGKRYVRKRAKK
jgi:hypothetical protein